MNNIEKIDKTEILKYLIKPDLQQVIEMKRMKASSDVYRSRNNPVDFNNGSLMYSNSSYKFQQIKFDGLNNVAQSKSHLQWCSTNRICFMEENTLNVHDISNNFTEQYDQVTSFSQHDYSEYLVYAGMTNIVSVVHVNGTIFQYKPQVPYHLNITHILVDNSLSTIVLSNRFSGIYMYDILSNTTYKILYEDPREDILAIEWNPHFDMFVYSLTNGTTVIYSLIDMKNLSIFIRAPSTPARKFSWNVDNFIAIGSRTDIHIWDVVSDSIENYINTMIYTNPDPSFVSFLPSLITGFTSLVLIIVVIKYSKQLLKENG